jgi:hypothetical protein
VCGKPAQGGTALEFGNSVMNKAIGKFRFFCLDCGGGIVASLSTALMYPSWKVVSNPEPGVYWLRHRTEKEQHDLLVEKP